MIDKLIHALAFGAAMILSGWAAAHEGMGPNGGRLADLTKHHIELVVKNDAVEVFVSDKASQPMSATGLTGFAIVVADGKSIRIPLVASDASKLSGKATVKLPDAGKSIVQVKLTDGQTIQATFD